MIKALSLVELKRVDGDISVSQLLEEFWGLKHSPRSRKLGASSNCGVERAMRTRLSTHSRVDAVWRQRALAEHMSLSH